MHPAWHWSDPSEEGAVTDSSTFKAWMTLLPVTAPSLRGSCASGVLPRGTGRPVQQDVLLECTDSPVTYCLH